MMSGAYTVRSHLYFGTGANPGGCWNLRRPLRSHVDAFANYLQSVILG